mgnify:CR=1 FL=1
MSKMGWIHYLASRNMRKELEEHLHGCGFKGTSKLAAKEFIKAANELEEKNNEMPNMRSRHVNKIQPKEKNSRTSFITVKKNTKNT